MTQKITRIKIVMGLLIIAAVILQACVPAVQTTSQPEVTLSPQSPQETPSGDDTSVMVDRTGTFRVAMQPIVQTDPAFIASDSEVLVANHVYDYLVDINPDSEIIPRLAKAWTYTEDGLTYIFQLEEGVIFHDQSPFSAADVVWTFNRLRDPALELPTTDLYANIANVEASGDLEVTFTLVQPNPFFLYDLSDNHALILKAGTQDPSTFNGTGPFVVSNYSPEDRIVMLANENYFIEDQPKLAQLEIIFFNDETAAVDALRSAQVDLAMRMSSALFASLQNEAGITTIDIPTNGFDLVRLRSDRDPGNNPLVVEALKLATDRDAIFQLVQQGFGSVGYDTPVGPLYTSYFTEDYTPPERDVEAARDKLIEAGYPDGISLTLHVPDSGNRPDLAVALQSQWAEAGINVEVVVEPESVYYGDEGWLEVDLGITGWGSRPYPQFYLDVMLKCEAIWNEAHFCDEEFDQLATIAGTTLDEDARIDAYADIQRLLVDRGPIIIPYFFAQLAAVSDNFVGFELKAFAGRTDFRNIQIIQP